jgi:hypothetical protein
MEIPIEVIIIDSHHDILVKAANQGMALLSVIY